MHFCMHVLSKRVLVLLVDQIIIVDQACLKCVTVSYFLEWTLIFFD